MLKILKSLPSFSLSITLLLSFTDIAVAQSGENICVGGWQYEQLSKCQLPGEIRDGEIISGTCLRPVVDSATYRPCRAQVIDEMLGCGPESYHSCPNMSCPGSLPEDGYREKRPGGCGEPRCKAGYSMIGCSSAGRGYVWISCTRKEWPALCENPTCKPKTWKECKHSSCPIDKAYYRCDEWDSGYSDSCGGITYHVTARGASRPDSAGSDGRRAKDHYGIGSECLTCNDIEMDSTAGVQKRFECLAKGIELAEASSPGYVFSTTYEILQQLQHLANTFSAQLNSDQAARLAEILSKYSLGG